MCPNNFLRPPTSPPEKTGSKPAGDQGAHSRGPLVLVSLVVVAVICCYVFTYADLGVFWGPGIR